ncbi:U3 small nucleolar RNA-associated protein 14-like protein C [Armadillidium vulgare]|nr:U3 small nucleolar RNA-associated protein 14-like protein C [Armadillidium vulgare]
MTNQTRRKEDFEDIFADVDYAKEFQEEKKEHEESRKLKDIDNFKAGWGSWGGPGIVISEKRKKRFRIKAPKTPSNKYSKVGNVIYKEKSDMHENLRKNMVSELPFPFAAVKDFEASIRQPIGRTFVPEVSHKKLIAPPVVQKMGTVIEPMGEECLIKNYEDHKRRKKCFRAEVR